MQDKLLELILFPYSHAWNTPGSTDVEGTEPYGDAKRRGFVLATVGCLVMGFGGLFLGLGLWFAVFLLGHPLLTILALQNINRAQRESAFAVDISSILFDKLIAEIRGVSNLQETLDRLAGEYSEDEYQAALAGAIHVFLETDLANNDRISAASIARLNEIKELKGQVKLQEAWQPLPFWDEYKHASILASIEDPQLPCPQIIEFNEMRSIPNLPVTPRGTEQILLLTDAVFVEIETYQTGQTFGESQGTIQGSTSGSSVNWGSDVSTSSGSFSGTQHSYSQSQTTMRDQQAWGDLVSGSFIVTSRSLAFRSDDNMVHRSLEFSEIASVDCIKPGHIEGMLFGGMIIDRPDRPRLAVISSYHASLLVRHIVSSENLSDEIEIPIKKMIDEANRLLAKTPLPEPDVKQPLEEPKVTDEAGSVLPKADSAEPDASRSPEDLIDKLERLSKLQESGVITAAELEEQKKRLLDS